MKKVDEYDKSLKGPKDEEEVVERYDNDQNNVIQTFILIIYLGLWVI